MILASLTIFANIQIRIWTLTGTQAWFERFSPTYADPSLFIRHYHHSLTVILLYADALIITGNDSKYISTLISQLDMVFEMKDLGPLHHFLGIEVVARLLDYSSLSPNMLKIC